jgi:hypothetical protein
VVECSPMKKLLIAFVAASLIAGPAFATSPSKGYIAKYLKKRADICQVVRAFGLSCRIK